MVVLGIVLFIAVAVGLVFLYKWGNAGYSVLHA